MAQKAPGKAFRTGISLKKVFQCSRTTQRRRSGLSRFGGPNGVTCPYCGSTKVKDGANHPKMRFRCRGGNGKRCYKFFSYRTKTLMEGSKLGPQTWVLAAYLLSTGIKGTSSMKLHRDLDISYKALGSSLIGFGKPGRRAMALLRPGGSRRDVCRREREEQARSKKLRAGHGPVGRQPWLVSRTGNQTRLKPPWWTHRRPNPPGLCQRAPRRRGDGVHG